MRFGPEVDGDRHEQYRAIERRLNRQLSASWPMLEHVVGLAKAVPIPTIVVDVQGAATDAAQVDQGNDGAAVITVAAPFLVALDDQISSNQHVLASLFVHDGLAAFADAGLVRAIVIDLAHRFVVLHEAYHYVGGHFAALQTVLGDSAYSLDETGPLFSLEGDGRSTIEPSLAYYLELEADSSGLQWLMQTRLPESLEALYQAGDPQAPGLRDERPEGIFDLDEPHRTAVFRMLMAAVWHVLLLLESRRHGMSHTHPLSGARLLAVISTMLEQFVEVDVVVGDEGRTATLDTDQRELAIAFFAEIVTPVALAPWSTGPPPINGPSHDRSAAADAAIVLDEFRRLMSSEVPASPHGQQLVELQTLVGPASHWLHRHRLFQPPEP
jgi:hypothetical protein